jgi:hypothetical protein
MLSISESEMMKSCKFFEILTNHEHELSLLKKRSLDTIMLCCLFFSVSISNNPISWNLILDHYQKQPQYFESTTNHVYMGEGAPRVDIKEFYKQMFAPRVKEVFMAMNVWVLGFNYRRNIEKNRRY